MTWDQPGDWGGKKGGGKVFLSQIKEKEVKVPGLLSQEISVKAPGTDAFMIN